MAIPAGHSDCGRTNSPKPSRRRLLLGFAGSVAAACAVAFGTPERAQTAATSALGAGNCTAPADWGAGRPALARRVVVLVNEHRRRIGLGPLRVSGKLTASSVWKARHMARFGYMAHHDPAPPVSRGAGDRIRACGYKAAWGENIAYGYPSPASVVAAWLRSPGHRANIENGRFAAIGVGAAARGDGVLFWAQNFGSAIG